MRQLQVSAETTNNFDLQQIIKDIEQDQELVEKLYKQNEYWIIILKRKEWRDEQWLFWGKTILLTIDNTRNKFEITNIKERNTNKYHTTRNGSKHIATMQKIYNTSDETAKELNDYAVQLRSKHIPMNEYFTKEAKLFNKLHKLLEYKAKDNIIGDIQYI